MGSARQTFAVDFELGGIRFRFVDADPCGAGRRGDRAGDEDPQAFAKADDDGARNLCGANVRPGNSGYVYITADGAEL